MSLVSFMFFSHLSHMSVIETYCASVTRNHDYDRFLITLFAKNDVRENLYSLYAFNHEIAKIREAVSEPMLGEIRLEWWREAIEGIANSNPRNHEVVLALSSTFHQHNLKTDMFNKIIDARAADIYDKNPANFSEFKKYLSCTSGNLMETAAWIVGERDAHVLSLSNKVGVAWGLIGTLRALRYHISLKKISLPQDLLDQHGVSKKEIFSMEATDGLRAMIEVICMEAERYLHEITSQKNIIRKNVKPLFLLTSLSRSYINMIKNAGYNPYKINEKETVFPRQCRLFFSALFGLI